MTQERSVIELDQGNFSRRDERAMPALAQPQAATPMSMLAMAVQKGMDLETIKELRALQKDFEADEARKAYNRAFASFKAQAVQIIKNRTVDAGPLSGKKYAELFAVVNALTPALSQNGLSASWKLTKDEKDWIEVTCTLKHELGHCEEVSMGGPPDSGGAKSAIQARASSVSYLQRYTLKAICGVSEQTDDDDGNMAGKKKGMDEATYQGFVKRIEAAPTKEAAKVIWQEGVRACEALSDLNSAKGLKAVLIGHAEFIDSTTKVPA